MFWQWMTILVAHSLVSAIPMSKGVVDLNAPLCENYPYQLTKVSTLLRPKKQAVC